MNPECFSPFIENGDPLYRFYDCFWRMCCREHTSTRTFVFDWPLYMDIDVFLATVLANGYAQPKELSFVIHWHHNEMRERIAQSCYSPVTFVDHPILSLSGNVILFTDCGQFKTLRKPSNYFPLFERVAQDVLTITPSLSPAELGCFIEWAFKDHRLRYLGYGVLRWILTHPIRDYAFLCARLHECMKRYGGWEYVMLVAKENHIPIMLWILSTLGRKTVFSHCPDLQDILAIRGQLQMCNAIWPRYETVGQPLQKYPAMVAAVRKARAIRLSARCWMWCWRWIRGVNRDVATLIGKRMLAQQYD